jgi:hypothetical protein
MLSSDVVAVVLEYMAEELKALRDRIATMETGMDRIVTWLFYIALALAVATLWLHFEAPHYHLPFQ